MKQHHTIAGLAVFACMCAVLYVAFFVDVESSTTTYERSGILDEILDTSWPRELDRDNYNARILALSGYDYTELTATTSTSTPQLRTSTSTNTTVVGSPWPPAQPYPHGGALLPFQRIIAYYGNFYSTRMGILGEFDEETVLARLASTTKLWEQADPATPVMPAVHYIAMVAQGSAGEDGMYRKVMPQEHIQKAHDMAKRINGILFLDLQIGLSSIQKELPQYREWLAQPDVHLALDPEFAMHDGTPPGKRIGRFEARDINYAIHFLADIVREHKLPPKVLIVHRFTENMVGDVSAITPRPEVQVVLHMDGWGSRQLKRNTYYHVVETDPLQFAGLKIFYKNDLKPPSTGIFTPEEALELHPKPVYIQYQ